MIDTHSHIYDQSFDNDIDNVINRALENGVDKILMPNIDLETIEPMLKLSDAYPHNCFSMMGLHPTSVDDNYLDVLKKIYLLFDKYKFIGVGEIGLDLYWDKSFLAQQIDALKIQLSWAIEKDLPISLHVRDAFDEAFEVFDSIDTSRLRGVFHSFGGNHEQLKKVLSYSNFMIGINGVVTFKNSKLDEVLKDFNLDRVVLETDAPYLTPVPFRGKRNEPAYVKYIAEKLADVFKLSVDEVINITTNNSINMFKIN